MFNMVLSCTNFPIVGPIIDALAHLLGFLMNWIYMFFEMIGFEDIGLCIIIFTFIVKLIMMPLTVKQQKFSKLSALMNPEMQVIQKKYKGKRDNDSVIKMREETNALYEKYGTSPSGSCLQLAIQMPILLALYSVISHVGNYISSYDVNNTANLFFGINLSEAPWNPIGFKDAAIASIAIPILSAVAQWYSMKLTTNMQTESNSKQDENPMMASMKTMTYTMPLFSLVMCFTLPAGVGLYWVASSVFQVFSQLIVNAHFKKIDMNDLIKKNVEKANKKKEKKGVSAKQVSNAASYNTRNIPKPKDVKDETKEENLSSTSTDVTKVNYKPGSLASKANMVKDYNNKSNKK